MGASSLLTVESTIGSSGHISYISTTTASTATTLTTTGTSTITSSTTSTSYTTTITSTTTATSGTTTINDSPATRPLHVEENKIKNDLGQIVYLRGVNRDFAYDDPSGCWGGWGVYYQSKVDLILNKMQSYGINCLRYIFTAEWWINNPTSATEQGTMTFRQILDDLLTRCANHGIYLDLVTFSVTYAGLEDMAYPTALIPNANAFVNYVVEQVDALGSHNNLILEFWDEPWCRSSWNTQTKLNEWQTVWQNIINGIRAKEDTKGYIHHLIIVGYATTLGYWGNLNDPWMNLNWIDSAPLSDSANNLAYTASCFRYYGSVGVQEPISSRPTDYTTIKNICTEEKVLYYSQSYPISIRGIGADIYTSGEDTWFANTLQIFNEWGIHYMSWDWRGPDSSMAEIQEYVAEEGVTGGTVNKYGQILVDAIKAGSA